MQIASCNFEIKGKQRNATKAIISLMKSKLERSNSGLNLN